MTYTGWAEVYPAAKSRGVDGFTFTNKEAAFAKLRAIVSQSAGAAWC